MPGTEDATYPFWSPDSRYIGFFTDAKLKKIAASGEPARALCDVAGGVGGSWNHDDVIVFSPAASGAAIQRVSAAGGVRQRDRTQRVLSLSGFSSRWAPFFVRGHWSIRTEWRLSIVAG